MPGPTRVSIPALLAYADGGTILTTVLREATNQISSTLSEATSVTVTSFHDGLAAIASTRRTGRPATEARRQETSQ